MSKNWWKGGYYYGNTFTSSYDDSTDVSLPWWKKTSSDHTSWKEAYKSRYRSSLGYSSNRLTDTTSYSSRYYGRYYKSASEKEKERLLLERAFNTARDLVIILDFPFRVSIQLSSGGNELDYGYDRRLFIPTNVLDEDKYTDEEKINICCGLAIHEAAHLKFTEAKVLRSFQERLRKTPEYNSSFDFIISLVNIIEDERVEDKLLTERPGYTEFIDISKTRSYKQFIDSRKTEISKIDLFLNNLFRLIRYPEGLDNDILEEYSELYTKIQELLTPLPESTKESCKKGFEIYKLIKENFKDLPKATIRSSFERFSSILGNLICNCYYGFDEDIQYSGIPDSFVFSLVNDSDIMASLITGTAESGSLKDTYFKRASGTKARYEEIATKVSPYVTAFRRLVQFKEKNYTYNIYGCRNGLLDTSKLVEAYQGVPQVYIRQGKVTTNKSVVCVLIDESGSMDTRNKDKKAREAAILINEAFKDLPGVDLYIYGHTADTISRASTEITIYREPGNSIDPYGLSSSQAKNENRDGTAIYEVGKRIRKFTSENCIMLVLSDGCPAACGYYGREATEDVRSKVKSLEKDGFTIIQITIDTVVDAKKMFTNVIDLKNNLHELPKILGKLINKLIIKDKKTTYE